MLGVIRKPSWIAGLSALGVAVVLAVGIYGMPVPQAGMSMVNGAAFGLFPIGWIVIASLVLYRVTVDTGKFEIIKNSIGSLSSDRRLQAILIAFAFGAFIEGAAGFGTPVAVAAAMLTGLGFSPFYAAFICLLANTAPVAFGSLGIPVRYTCWSYWPRRIGTELHDRTVLRANCHHHPQPTSSWLCLGSSGH